MNNKIYFSLPGYHSHYRLNIGLLKIMKDHKEKFYEDIVIDSVYDCFPNCIWNGGRILFGNLIKPEEILNIIQEYNKFKVSIRHTFTNELLDEIRKRDAQIVNVTLHVGAGTWMPVKTEDLSEHKMHSEWCCITPEQADIINNAKRVIAVGTTSMRTLESASQNAPDGMRVAPICTETSIFITPGYKFRAVDVLLTNFHLPKSTLFMLVSAFSGLSEMKNAYKHAVNEKYRFFSYGDCCLLFKKDV